MVWIGRADEEDAFRCCNGSDGFFFYRLNKELLQTTLNYLGRESAKILTTQQQQHLAKSGDGIKASMESLREMLPSLKASLN